MHTQLSTYDDAHRRRIEQYARRMEALYHSAIARISVLGAGLQPQKGKPFNWEAQPHLRRRATEIFADMARSMEALIKTGNEKEWLAAAAKNDIIARKTLQNSPLPAKVLQQYYNRNSAALATFNTRQEKGLTLANRVRKYTRQFKAETEMCIDLMAGKRTSAGALAAQMKQYLKEPHMLLQAMKDKHGHPAVAQATENHHPGRGIYRSSYKNALRLARTEINTAYRTADHLRWQQMDFVVGKQIKLSKAHKITDMCDHLQGNYPKDFTFTGWHPQCMCHMIPLLLTGKEYAQWEAAKLKGKNAPVQSQHEVKDVPPEFKEWMERNRERMVRAKSKPDFIRENEKHTAQTKVKPKDYSIYGSFDVFGLVKTNNLDISEVEEVMSKYAAKNKTSFARGYKKLEIAPEGAAYFMETDTSGIIRINFAVKDGFDAGTNLVNAIKKINTQQPLTEHEEYAIEVLWHEILHNKAKGVMDLPPINSVDGFKRASLETINQLVARNTYPDFMKAIGGEAKHQNWVLENGFGYRLSVDNLRKLIKTSKVKEEEFTKKISKVLFNQSYEVVGEEARQLVAKMAKKDKEKIIWIFERIEFAEEMFNNYLEILH